MHHRDLELLDGFLARVKRDSLHAWLGLDEDAPVQEALKALVERRRWAQAQQANPKYREEALWVIRHHDLLKRALSTERQAWLDHVRGRRHARDLDLLTHFITGTVAGGVLTPEGEAAIREQAESYGIPVSLVEARIEEVLARTGARRTAPAPASRKAGDGDFVDFYGLLGVPPDATLEAIERAHRARYRWARSLGDLEQASRTYALLDEAWRVLRDPERRRSYDERHAAWRAGRPDPGAPPVGATLPHDPTASGIPPVKQPRRRRARPPRSAHRRPPPPPAPAGSVGLGRTSTTAGPRLTVDAPAELTVQVGRRPALVEIPVRNAGRGPMPGRVRCNRSWVRCEPAALDPRAREQVLTLRVEPPQEPLATAVVTVEAGDAGTRRVTLQVRRRRRLLLAPLAGLAVLLAGAGALAWRLVGAGGAATAGPAVVHLEVFPPADAIRIEGALAGSGTTASWRGDPGPDGRIRVEAVLDGFRTWREDIPVEPGQEVRREVHLELVDPMDWRPPPDATGLTRSLDALRRVVEARRTDLEACVRRHLADRPGFRAHLRLAIYVTATGQARGLAFEDRNFASDEVDACLRRVVRPLRFPLLPGDHAVIPLELEVAIPGGGP